MLSQRAGHLLRAAVAVTVAVSLAYVAVPVYETSSGHATLPEENGWWVIAVLLAPVALAALPYLATDKRRSVVRCAAAALTLFALVTGFTIGIPYLLPAGLLVLAGAHA
jgi:cytochrome bd-type quinol oxidase subunit 2